MANLEDRMPAYATEESDGRYAVVDGAGRTVLACSDRMSAGHYADLMNQAFESGYKTGYRDASAD